MPKRNLRYVRKAAKKTPPKRKLSRRRAAKSSLGSLIATATTTLLSYIPGGTAFKPIADYAFKSFGWSTGSFSNSEDEDNIDAELLYAAPSSIAGVSSNIALPYVRLVANSQYGAQTTSSVRAGPPQATFISKYDEVRLTSLKITIIPTGSLGSRQGMWCAVFLPVLDVEAEDELQRGTSSNYCSIPSYNDLQMINGSVTRPAQTKIIINYSPNTPYTRDFHHLKEYVGILKIAYLDMERERASKIEPSEFNSQVEVDCTFMFRQAIMKDKYDTYTTKILDLTEGLTLRFDHQGRAFHKTETGLISHSSHSCFVPLGRCIESPKNYPLLSKMTLEDDEFSQ